MKDEIKEILEDLDFQVNHTKNWVEPLGLDQKTWKQLLDYITILQEKYEEADNDRHKLFEQKEKAIEYIKENTIHYISYLGKEPKIVPKIELQREKYDKLLNILQGEDKE